MKVTKEFIDSITQLARKHTPQQIAVTLGENYGFILNIMHQYDIDILTKKDQALYRIYRECHLYTKAEMMVLLGISSSTMTTYLKDVDIRFKDQPNAHLFDQSNHRIPIYDKRNEIRQRLAERLRFQNTLVRIKEAYTQSGSPFGIADQLNSK